MRQTRSVLRQQLPLAPAGLLFAALFAALTAQHAHAQATLRSRQRVVKNGRCLVRRAALHVGLLCALSLFARVGEGGAATFGAGILSNQALFVLIPPNPILPQSTPPIAIYQIPGNPVRVITFDCTAEVPATETQPADFFASGADDAGTPWYIHIQPTELTNPASACQPTDFPGLPNCGARAAISNEAAGEVVSECFAGGLETAPVPGFFGRVTIPNPI